MKIKFRQEFFRYKIATGIPCAYKIPFKEFIDTRADVSFEKISSKHIKNYCDFLGDIFGFDIKFNESIKSKC
jgi:hypothetical protein